MPKKETFLIILLCFLSRLPQLLSNNLMLDGDECIVAVMAKHFYECRELPLYFYGQSYGFSLIEILFIDPFYFLFGISDISVKLAMLLMWTIGVVLFYKTLLLFNLKNSLIPICITLILIFAPAWAVWSMKARGGYLTSFLLTFIITSLIFNERINKKNWIWILTGILLILIFESQPLWLPGLFPLVIYKLYTSEKKKYGLILLGSIVCSEIIFLITKKNIVDVWHPQIFEFSSQMLHAIVDLPRRIYINLTGSYYISWDIYLNFITNFWAVCFTALVLSVPVILFLLRKKISTLILITFVFSVLGSLSYILLIGDNAARYMLPFLGYFLFLLAFILDATDLKPLVKIITVFFVVVGAISVYTFKDFRYKAHTKENVIHLIETLESKGIHHVFCANALLQWQLMFYSNERIIARFSTQGERYRHNLTAVNNAFRSDRKKVAITGTLPERSKKWREFINVDDQFYINENPTDILLTNYGFDLNVPK